MSTQHINQSLIHLGLDERQSRLYIHLLKQPKHTEFTVFSIAKAIGIPRSTVYLTLSELESKKLVFSYKKNNILRYVAGDPSRLGRELEEKQDIFTSILPALQSLSEDSMFSPSVQTFFGAKGVKLVFDDVFDKPRENGVREFHTIAHPKLTQYMPKQLAKYMEQKKKHGLHTKMIIPDSFKKNTPKEYAPDSHRTTRFLPSPHPFEGTFIIYGKKTALFSHRDNEVYSMIIDSPAITEMLDCVFVSLWNLLPETN